MCYVLFVDDNPRQAYPYRKALETQGHAVTVVNDLAMLPTVMTSRCFDVLIVDLHMPTDGIGDGHDYRSGTRTGIWVLNLWRSCTGTKPAAVLTNVRDDALVEELRSQGVKCFSKFEDRPAVIADWVDRVMPGPAVN